MWIFINIHFFPRETSGLYQDRIEEKIVFTYILEENGTMFIAMNLADTYVLEGPLLMVCLNVI